MSRIPSSFALSLWGGFFAVTAAAEAFAAFGADPVAGVPIVSVASTPATAAAVALGSAAISAAMLFALVRMNSDDAARVRLGERVACGAIGAASSAVLAAALFGPPLAAVFGRIDLALWSVGLSLLALGFDAVVHVPDDEDDELAFRKALLASEPSRPADGRDERFGHGGDR